MSSNSNMYMELINCRTPEEVYATVRDWISNLTDHEHLVRSTILDIHADIERVMKQTLYHILLSTIFYGDDEAKHKQPCEKLEKMIIKLNFSAVHRLLKPAFDAFPAPDLANIEPINQVRGQVAHRQDMSEVQYKGRSPFADPDCLAQLFFEGWAIRQEVSHFFERMISDPRAIADHYAKFYHEHHGKLKDDSA